MKLLVNKIVAPYFQQKKVELKRDPDQRSMWKSDCWSVHRSEGFLGWMKKTHPTIIIIFVPGGCTLDVGIQRPMKLSLKQAAHRDIVAEIRDQLDDGVASGAVWMDTTLGTLRNRSVGWIVDATGDINRPELIQRAFKLCKVGDLPPTNPALYAGLTHQQAHPDEIRVPDEMENTFSEPTHFDNGSKVPVDVLAQHVMGAEVLTPSIAVDGDGSLMWENCVEDLELDAPEESKRSWSRYWMVGERWWDEDAEGKGLFSSTRHALPTSPSVQNFGER
ncbi:hypothetical protein ONZ45_g19277 [Pleurotus djamor]|nr:hypothetical protein ONZ45_g19277 [Pleurotus djamor]